jgi:hypothetical protein
VLAVVLALLAAQAPEPPRLRVLVMDLTTTGVEEETVRTTNGLIAVELGSVPGIDVVTGSDMKKLVELQAEKQTMGCDEATCLSEIAGALDAKLVVFGDIGRLGKLLVVNLSLYDAEKAQAVGRASAQAATIEQLPDTLGPAVIDLVKPALVARGMAVPDRTSAAVHRSGTVDEGPGVAPFALLGAGGLLAVAGIAGLGVAAAPFVVLPALSARAVAADVPAVQRAAAIDEARAWRTAGSVALFAGGGAFVVGAAALAGGALLLFGGGE